MSELKPCPFCAGGVEPDVLVQFTLERPVKWASCPDCGLQAPLETWNTRDDSAGRKAWYGGERSGYYSGRGEAHDYGNTFDEWKASKG